jgi:hypothetical protein
MGKVVLMLSILAMLAASGCASNLMQLVEPESLPQAINEDESAVVFLRPSFIGGAIQAPVVEAANNDLTLVGIVSTGDKVLSLTSPGKHYYVVGGESSDLLEAELEGGKVYYVYVSPALGFWKARFELEPVNDQQLSEQTFRSDLAGCKWRASKPEAQQWFKDNLPSLNSKYIDAMAEHNSAPPEKRNIILPEYGSSEFLQ